MLARNWLLAHWRRVAMQAALVGVLAVTIGLAAVATHQKRLALRLPLGHSAIFGRLRVALPRNWSPPAISEETSGGDSIAVDEVLPDGLPGRRLTIQRQRTTGLIAPLEHLLRTPYLVDVNLEGDDGDRGANPSGQNVPPPQVRRIEVAGWPGVMVSRAIGTLGGRRVQKQVLACAVLPPAQAVVIRLEGPGAPDAADDELVRQMAESVAVRDGREIVARPDPGGVVELGDGVFAPVPDHFCKLPADANRTSRDLIADGRGGAWTAIELIPCLWLPEVGPDADERALLALLTARDHEWRSGPVKRLGDGMWQVDRLDGAAAAAPGSSTGGAGSAAAAAPAFPSRAYCLSNGLDQALIAIMHGGWHEDGGFDAAWRAICANVRFTARKDLAALLLAGREQVARMTENGAGAYMSARSGLQDWWLWDQSENADKQRWMRLSWGLTDAMPSPAPTTRRGPASVTAPTTAAGSEALSDGTSVYHGTRTLWLGRAAGERPIGWFLRLYDNDPAQERGEQEWFGTADFTRYHQHSDRIVSRSSESRFNPIGRWELQGRELRNLLTGEEARVPEQFVPGAWLPLVLGKLAADQPIILRTESFLGSDAASPRGLLALHVARVAGASMPSLTVTVNGTGQVSRWWYDLDGTLRYIDFPGGLRAQRDDGGPADRR